MPKPDKIIVTIAPKPEPPYRNTPDPVKAALETLILRNGQQRMTPGELARSQGPGLWDILARTPEVLTPDRFGKVDTADAIRAMMAPSEQWPISDTWAYHDWHQTLNGGVQPFMEAMRQAGNGSLVGIASVAGLRGLPGSGAYSASKAAAISYLESLRVELAGSGVSVTTICPGFIRTPMTEVNPYRMPFLMEAEVAARKMARAIDHRRRYVILPWQMALVGRVMRLLPAWLWDTLTKNFKHKPRL